jgi:hypothetical protein
MKYKITDSQLESVIFSYLNSQGFIQVDYKSSIHFIDPADDNYAVIIYMKNDGWCGIYRYLVEEISSYFSLDNTESKAIIAKWVENKLQMKVGETPNDYWSEYER